MRKCKNCKQAGKHARLCPREFAGMNYAELLVEARQRYKVSQSCVFYQNADLTWRRIVLCRSPAAARACRLRKIRRFIAWAKLPAAVRKLSRPH